MWGTHGCACVCVCTCMHVRVQHVCACMHVSVYMCACACVCLAYTVVFEHVCPRKAGAGWCVGDRVHSMYVSLCHCKHQNHDCILSHMVFPISSQCTCGYVECFSRVISSISMQRDTLHPSIKLKTHAYTQHKCPQLKFMQAALCLLQTQAHNDGGKGHATE